MKWNLRDWCHELPWYTGMTDTYYHNTFWNFLRIVLYVGLKMALLELETVATVSTELWILG